MLVGEVLGTHGWQVWPIVPRAATAGDPRGWRPSPCRQVAGDGREQAGEIPEGLDRDATLDLLMSHCIEPAIRD